MTYSTKAFSGYSMFKSLFIYKLFLYYNSYLYNKSKEKFYTN